MNNRSAILIILLFCCSSCAISPDARISFTKPPELYSLLRQQPRLVVCKSQQSARSIASTGFFNPECRPLTLAEDNSYRVIARHYIKLNEGKMWLIQTLGPTGDMWVPIPWHDWN